jgi:hypothetical protein
VPDISLNEFASQELVQKWPEEGAGEAMRALRTSRVAAASKSPRGNRPSSANAREKACEYGIIQPIPMIELTP